MLRLFLNNMEAFPEGNTSIKVIKENPYFTASGSYTMDVTLSAAVPANRSLVQNIHRIDRAKQVQTMTAKLMSGGRLIMQGTAVVTSIKEDSYKVQIVGGNAEVNFLSKYGDEYVDKVEFPPIQEEVLDPADFGFPGEYYGEEKFMVCDGSFVVYPTEEVPACGYHASHQHGGYPLVFGGKVMRYLKNVVSTILDHFGYRLAGGMLQQEPWNSLVVCQERLPHWTVAEFIKQLQQFLNATIVFDEQQGYARVVGNNEFFSQGMVFLPDVVDEYEAETADEDEVKTQALASSNLRYAIEQGENHLYDVVDEDLLECLDVKNFDSLEGFNSFFASLTDAQKSKYIFDTPDGRFVYSEKIEEDQDTVENSNVGRFLREVDHFGRLKRNDADDEIELKIVPAAMKMVNAVAYVAYQYTNVMGSVYFRAVEEVQGGGSAFIPTPVPVVEEEEASQRNNGDAWKYIIGEEETEAEPEKADTIQVMFVKSGIRTSSNGRLRQLGFTDPNYKRPQYNVNGLLYDVVFPSWSLSLRERTRAEKCVGKLHHRQGDIKINSRTEYRIEFISETIPDVCKVFVIRNKRFVCKKIEISVDQDGVDSRMKGYFYEILSP